MKPTIHFYIFVILCLQLGAFHDAVRAGVISSSMYDGYAFIGSNLNTKISFATLLEKKNRSEPYSKDGNPYELKHVFGDQTKEYGTSVALGKGFKREMNVTLGAITSPEDNYVYIYEFDECTKTECEPIIEFSTDSSSSYQSSSSYLKKDKSKCDIGEVYFGNNFAVVQCQNNLLNAKVNASAVAICIFDLETNGKNCSETIYWGTAEELIPQNDTFCTKGQLYATAVGTFEDKIILSVCGVCMSPDANQVKVQYYSWFVVIQVIMDNAGGGEIVRVQSVNPSMGESCPSSASMSTDWAAIGFSEENHVDLYSLNTTNIYDYFTEVSEDYSSFGSQVGLGANLLIVTAHGDTSQDIISKTFFYEIFKDENTLPGQNRIEASIPNLNYKTEYSYSYSTAFYGDELLVVSQDITLTKMGFNFFGVCPKGSEWNSLSSNCTQCPPGQFKYISNNGTMSGSFELCYPCPKGYFTGNITGIETIKECQVNPCNSEEFCPDGSIFPLLSIPIESTSTSNPDPNSSEELDFESTFYNSCYPYFLLILGGTLVISLSLCLPWPTKNQRYRDVQTKIIKALLQVNFYDWDGETMTVDYFVEEEANSDAINLNSTNLRSSKRGIFVKKRRTSVKPVKAVESFCSYYFLIVFVLMCVFIVQFQHVNNDTTLELRPLGQASSSPPQGQSLSDAEYLKFLDSSQMTIQLDLYGYSGECNPDEFSLTIQGCQKANYMGSCNYTLDAYQLYDVEATHCVLVVLIRYGAEYSVDTIFDINMSPTNYFYVQRILYNISTSGADEFIDMGTSSVNGVVQPDEGTILRPYAEISILSMLTLIADCKIRSSDSGVGLSLIRPMIERCAYDSGFKDLSQISNSSSYIRSADYHNADPTFTFTIRMDKSTFYHYATTSHSVSFGEIVTVIMFAVLDVFWVIEVIVPLIQFVVALFEEQLKKRKAKAQNDENYDQNSEMSRLFDKKTNKPLLSYQSSSSFGMN